MKNIFGEFFLFCSGASREVLELCAEAEKTKYKSIGVTVLFTGLFATLSCFYALYQVFVSEPFALHASLALSLLWGIFVFNLDRYLVSTVKKEGVFWKDFRNVSPRILLAIIIAIVIATPLKVKIFEDRLHRQIYEMEKLELTQDRAFYENEHSLNELRATEENIAGKLSLAQEKSVGEPEDELYSYQIGLHASCEEDEEGLQKRARTEVPRLRINLNDRNREMSVLVDERKSIASQIAERKITLAPIRDRIKEIRKAVLAAQAPASEVFESRSGVIVVEPRKPGDTRPESPEIPEDLLTEQQNLEQQIDDLEQRLRSVQRKINDLDRIRENIRLQIDEVSKAPSFKRDECSSIFGEIRKIRADAAAMNASRALEIEEELAAHRTRLQEAEGKAAAGIKRGEDVIAVSFGVNFINQLEALEELLAEPYTVVWWTHWMLSFLFILVETAPILVKLLTPKSPYDEISEKVDRESTIAGNQLAVKHRETKIKDVKISRVENTTGADEILLRKYVDSLTDFSDALEENFTKFEATSHRLGKHEDTDNLLALLRALFADATSEALSGFEERWRQVLVDEAVLPQSSREASPARHSA